MIALDAVDRVHCREGKLHLGLRSFRDDLRIDSLDLYEVVTALEDEYGIEIQPEDLDGIFTVGDVVEFLAKRGIE